jgi:hypothetical protein
MIAEFLKGLWLPLGTGFAAIAWFRLTFQNSIRAAKRLF